MATDAFGLSDTSPEEMLGLVEVEETEAEEKQKPEETTVEEPAQAAEETPSEGQPRDEFGRFTSEAPEAEAEAQTEEQPEAQAEETEVSEPQEEQPRLWANKYQTPDELEKGYNESREMWRRSVESRKAEQAARYQAEMREAELANIIREAVPYLNEAAKQQQYLHALAEQYRQETGAYPQGYTGPPSQEQKALAPADVNRLVEQRLDAERRQLYGEFVRNQEFQATSDAVMGFYRDHPEVEPRGVADNGITETMEVLNESWAGRTGEQVDMADRGSIEVLYEASQRPALREVLALKPEYFDSEGGLNLARMEASVLEGAPTPSATQQTHLVPASQVGKTSGQRKPFAESAVTGAEAEEQVDENDPWEQIKQVHAKSKNTASVFQFE